MDWKDYEEEIFIKFNLEFKNHEIIKNAHILGKFSKVQRQIDILIKSQIAGYGVFGVVECKYFSKKVDVKVVDSFIGFLEDVGANLGIIITNEGFTEGAKNRAEIKGIRLDILNFDDLENYHYELEFCHVCDPGEDRPPAVVSYHGVHSYRDIEDIQYLFEFGNCDWCNSLHIRCHSCGSSTAVWDGDYGSLLECEGGCGIKYLVTLTRDGDEIVIISKNDDELTSD